MTPFYQNAETLFKLKIHTEVKQHKNHKKATAPWYSLTMNKTYNKMLCIKEKLKSVLIVGVYSFIVANLIKRLLQLTFSVTVMI